MQKEKKNVIKEQFTKEGDYLEVHRNILCTEECIRNPTNW
jgi:hypothetical protein